MALEDLGVDVLRKAGEPLHYRQIATRIVEAGQWPGPPGRTPEASIRMQMAREARLKGAASRLDFERGSGIYWLREWGTPPGRKSDIDSPALAIRPAADQWSSVLESMAAARLNPNFDQEERTYKLEVAEKLRDVIAQAAQGNTSWLADFRRALGPPNNLTDWRLNEQVTSWGATEEGREPLRAAIATFADSALNPVARFDAFATRLAPLGLGVGSVIVLGSLLNFAAAPEELPPVRTSRFETVERVVGWPEMQNETATVRYESHLGFAWELWERLDQRGTAIRDMLDVQSLIWTFTATSSSAAVPSVVTSAAGRYGPLGGRLSRETGDAMLTFAEIESLVGPLPPYLRSSGAGWYGRATNSPTHTQKKAWETAGYTVRTIDLPGETVTFRRLLPNEIEGDAATGVDGSSAVASSSPRRYWWVNQGQSYERESKGGYVWAPMRGRSGAELPHHRAVSDLAIGDATIHYQASHIRALGIVTAAPTPAKPPSGLPGSDPDRDGRLARVEYTTFDPPIALNRIPIDWRTAEGGPFNNVGTVNQGYLFPLSENFVRKLAGRISEIADALGIEGEASSAAEQAGYVPVTDLAVIASTLREEGLVIDDRLLRRYHLAVNTRGFVILAGISGTGKTWLAEEYGHAVGGKVLLVPVAPNWTSNEDLLGYLNPYDHVYNNTAFSRFIREAGDEWVSAGDDDRFARPYFLILDEMNLARVEYYFAAFLSQLEVRSRDVTATIELGDDEVILGPNLKFIGTVNVDETTHGFADKVYDRAQLIELEAPREALMERLGNTPIAGDVLAAWDAIHDVAPFAFRVVDEMRVYTDAAQEVGVTWQEALDEQLLQKVLPKVRGLDNRVEQCLRQFVELTRERFPLTYAKAQRMLSAYNQHGSVSFFE